MANKVKKTARISHKKLMGSSSKKGQTPHTRQSKRSDNDSEHDLKFVKQYILESYGIIK